MPLVSMTTATTLLILWFVIVAFALASLAYFIFSLHLRRQQYAALSPPDARESPIFRLKERAAQIIEYTSIVIVLAVLALLSANWIALYANASHDAQRSQNLARRLQDEQYSELRVTPRLLFAASNENTVGGSDATVGSAFVIDAKLEDALMRAGRCDGHVHELARLAEIHLESADLAFSKAPAIDDADPCYVKWSWVAVPARDGMLVVLAAGALRLPGGQVIHFEKPVRIVVDPAGGIDGAAISSVVVGLLSLTGIILTALMNRRKPGADNLPS